MGKTSRRLTLRRDAWHQLTLMKRQPVQLRCLLCANGNVRINATGVNIGRGVSRGDVHLHRNGSSDDVMAKTSNQGPWKECSPVTSVCRPSTGVALCATAILLCACTLSEENGREEQAKRKRSRDGDREKGEKNPESAGSHHNSGEEVTGSWSAELG